jgi:tagatose 1,6-diphosphate aldolase
MLSAGKLWGLRRLADDAGRWKMIAVDQRPPVMQPIARQRGLAEAPYDDVAAVKRLLTQHLSPVASAMLLDPNYAYPQGVGVVSPRTGLCLTLEHHVTQDHGQGRLSQPIPHWSVAQIRRIGADAVKLLVWYRPDAPEAVRAHQQALVRRIGQECRDHDIVLLLELLVYPLAGDAPGHVDAHRTQLVLDSMRDFADPGFGVDIYKLEPPAMLRDVPDPEGPQAAAVQRTYDALGALTTRPWVLLSAASGPVDFERSLTYACRAGASGYLCGRAIWQDAFDRFPDLAAMGQALALEAVPYVQGLNALTDRLATPWSQHPAWRDGIAMTGDGPDFAAAYGQAAVRTA